MIIAVSPEPGLNKTVTRVTKAGIAHIPGKSPKTLNCCEIVNYPVYLIQGALPVNEIFDACVLLLRAMAETLGMTYQAINVWIFVILWPLLTICLVVIIIRQRTKIRVLKNP